MLIEIYVDFMIKCYKIDYIRARRVLIENKSMQVLDHDIQRKTTLICVLKILDAFMEGENLDVFVYLYNHQLFKGLKGEYLRNAVSRNVINSCFRSLLKKIKYTESAEAKKYFELVFHTGAVV